MYTRPSKFSEEVLAEATTSELLVTYNIGLRRANRNVPLRPQDWDLADAFVYALIELVNRGIISEEQKNELFFNSDIIEKIACGTVD